jgi:hypothetical protein
MEVVWDELQLPSVAIHVEIRANYRHCLARHFPG